ncbi:MAG TPA: hypothetical protein VMH86_00565 [Rhizomicrobium sp.]|nr:hypothetical protein [Rhizomicrobium sp.]
MRLLAAALALFALLAQGADAPVGRTVTLPLPSSGLQGRLVILEVTVGRLPSGAEIDVTGDRGEPLGTISPFGLKAGAPAGTFPVPIPPSALGGNSLTVTLTLHAGGTFRAPTEEEVKAIKLVQGPKLPD